MTQVLPESTVPILDGPRLGIAKAAERLGVVRQSVFRWLTKGVLLADGRRVKLAGIRLGSRWYTSETAIADFVAATTNATTNPNSPATPTPAQQSRAALAASRELDKLFIA